MSHYRVQLIATHVSNMTIHLQKQKVFSEQLWLGQVTSPLSLIIIAPWFYGITPKLIYLFHVKVTIFRFAPTFVFIDISICSNICRLLGKHLTIVPQWLESAVHVRPSMAFWVWYLWVLFVGALPDTELIICTFDVLDKRFMAWRKCSHVDICCVVNARWT